MKSYFYHRPGLHGDLVLGIASIIAGLIFTVAASETVFLFTLFLLVTLLALFFTWNSLRRYWIEIRTDGEAVVLINRGKEAQKLRWSEVTKMKLRFFGSKSQREKGKGTLSLTLIDQEGRKIAFESGLINFEDLAKTCFDMTRDHAVDIDSVSAQNFQSVGAGPQ